MSKKPAISIASELVDSHEGTGLTVSLIVNLLYEKRHGLAIGLIEQKEILGENHNLFFASLVRPLMLAPDLDNIKTLAWVNDDISSWPSQIYRSKLNRFEEQILSLMVVTICAPLALFHQEYSLYSRDKYNEALDRVNDGKLNSLYDTLKEISSFIAHGFSIEDATIEKNISNIKRQERLNVVKNELDVWMGAEQHFSYHLAEVVFKDLKKEAGRIGDIYSDLRNGVQEVELILHKINLIQKDIDSIIVKRLKTLGAKRSKEIVGKASRKLNSLIFQFCELAKEWISLSEFKVVSGAGYTFVEKQTTGFKRSFNKGLDSSLSELNSIINEQKDIRLCFAASKCMEMLGLVRSRLTGEPCDSGIPPNVRLYGNLAGVPDIDLDAEGAIHIDLGEADAFSAKEVRNECASNSIGKIIRHVANGGQLSFVESFNDNLQKGNHDLTGFILESLTYFPEQGIDLDDLYKRRQKGIQQQSDKLSKSIKNCKEKLDGAISDDLLALEVAENQKSLLRGLERVCHSFSTNQENIASFNFVSHNRLVESINFYLGSIQDDRKVQVLERIEKLKLTAEEQDRINSAVENRQFTTAFDYLDRKEQRKPLPELFTEDTGVFKDFFQTEFQKNLLSWRETSAPELIISSFRDRRDICGRTLKKIPRGTVTDNALLLTLWFNAQRKKVLDRASFLQIINLLGFQVREHGLHNGEKGDIYDKYTFNTTVINDKDIVPSYQFGSEANGTYDLLFFSKRPQGPFRLVEIVKEKCSNPAIVFYNGPMDQETRCAVRVEAKRLSCLFILLDDLLLLYMCMQNAPKITTMFKCALPFSFLKPYLETPGKLPPELFYGRRYELQDLGDKDGSCIIYGGRQLGKTALLHQLKFDMHDPKNNKIVSIIDLKSKGYSWGSREQDFWWLVATQLKEDGMDGFPVRRGVEFDGFSDLVKHWLKAKDSRAVILMIDEADYMIEPDEEKDYLICSQLKGLMEETDRQFKVILSGLHNVQRTTTSNNPLAHLGKAICIGSFMLSPSETREAERLIQVPFSTAGYYLDPAAISSILAQTNYYPSLIVVFCREAFKYLDRTGHRLKAKNPPFDLGSDLVNEIIRSEEIQSQIRAKFELTLDRDDRYKVIAYTAAYEYQSEQKSWSARFIWVKAREWCAKVFEDYFDEVRFPALLDEMCGLGLLKKHKEYYTLNSHNVENLLGAKRKIEDALLSFEANPKIKKPSGKLDADNRREVACATREEAKSLPLYSTLSVKQEGLIREGHGDVFILTGTNAAGLNITDLHLKDLPNFARTFEGKKKLKYIINDLKAYENRNDGSLFVLNRDVPWNLEWLIEIFEHIKGTRNTVAFVADPKKLWELYIEGSLPSIVFKEVTVGPWKEITFNEWCEEQITGLNPDLQRRIWKNLGGWPINYGKINPGARNLANHVDNVADVTKRQLMDDFGLNILIDNGHLVLLKELYEENLAEMIADKIEIGVEAVEPILQWGKQIGIFLYEPSSEIWRLDPFITSQLKKHFEDE